MIKLLKNDRIESIRNPRETGISGGMTEHYVGVIDVVKRTKKLCSVSNCSNSQIARGWCAMHYKRWSKYGDPTVKKRFNTPEESFAARTEWRGDCLIWTGAKNPAGYGNIRVNGRTLLAHRYAWERANGSIPDGLLIDHIDHCSPACCNPSHLRLATPSQNQYNRSGPMSKSRSGVRNVHWDKSTKTWKVKVIKNRKSHWFGRFADFEDAKRAAQEARQELFGEYAGRGVRGRKTV